MRKVLGITFGILLVASTGFSKMARSSKPKWAVAGLYVEACRRDAVSPSFFP